MGTDSSETSRDDGKTSENSTGCQAFGKNPTEEIQGLLKKDDSHPFQFPHVTFVKGYDDLKYKKCTVDGCLCVTKQHCPMCVDKTSSKNKKSNNITTSFTQLKRHMRQYHWNKAVKHKGELIK